MTTSQPPAWKDEWDEEEPEQAAPDRQPQQEYIIVPKELIDDIKTCLKLGCDGTLPNEGELLRAIELYSRPHSIPPAPAPECVNCKCSDCIPMKHIVELSEIKCKEAAKAERERARQELLKDLQTFIDDADSHIGCPQGTLGTAYLVRWMGGQGWDCD
jgi:hypothetical protein